MSTGMAMFALFMCWVGLPVWLARLWGFDGLVAGVALAAVITFGSMLVAVSLSDS